MILLKIVLSACFVLAQGDSVTTSSFTLATTSATSTTSTDGPANTTGDVGSSTTVQATTTEGQTETPATSTSSATATSTSTTDGEEEEPTSTDSAETAESQLPEPALADAAPQYAAYSEQLSQLLEKDNIAPIMNDVIDYFTPAAELTVTSTPTAINDAAREPLATILAEFSSAAANPVADAGNAGTSTGTGTTTGTTTAQGTARTGTTTGTTAARTTGTSTHTTQSSTSTGSAQVPTGNDGSKAVNVAASFLVLGLSLAIFV